MQNKGKRILGSTLKIIVGVVLVAQLCRTLQPNGLWLTRLLHPWDSLGKNTGVGCNSLLQKIFLTQGSNPHLPHHRQILYNLSYREGQINIIGGCRNKVGFLGCLNSWTPSSSQQYFLNVKNILILQST